MGKSFILQEVKHNITGGIVSASICGFLFLSRKIYTKEASTYPEREQHTPVSCV